MACRSVGKILTRRSPLFPGLRKFSAASEIGISGVDHVEFYVGSGRAWSNMMVCQFGFETEGFQGLETGHRSVVSYWMRQNNICLRITAALDPKDKVARHVSEHGDGVAKIAFKVANARGAYEEAISRGAKGIKEPQKFSDEHGEVELASIGVYGDVEHVFVDRSKYRGKGLPGFGPVCGVVKDKNAFGGAGCVGLSEIDHCVANVEEGNMQKLGDFYQKVFGFDEIVHFSEKEIATSNSALRSLVCANKDRSVMLPVNEPASGKGLSQIQEYLDANRGPGCQHLALTTSDIVSTVRALRARGVRMLATPDAYYQAAPARIGDIHENMKDLQENQILIDREDQGYLLQIFTQPLPDRPTFFFEIIQRRGARGFGKGNFLSLFESIEDEQRRRNNL